MLTIARLSSCACATSIRSKGSLWVPGNEPARMPCSIADRELFKSLLSEVTGKVRCKVRRDRQSAEANLGSRSPRRKQRSPARRCSCRRSVFCAESGREESSVNHQIRVWVSSRRRIPHYSQRSSSSGGSGSKNSGPMLIFPLKTPGFRLPFLSSIAVRRTTGFEPRAITTSSPLQTSSINFESWVFAL